MIVNDERLSLVEYITKYYGDENESTLLPYHNVIAERLASCVCSLNEYDWTLLNLTVKDYANGCKDSSSVRSTFKEMFTQYGDAELGEAVGEGIMVNLKHKEESNVRS